MAIEDYSDIIHLPYRGRKEGGLSMYQRAAQFAPFAALTGFDAAIRETARLTDGQIEPTPNPAQSNSLELSRCEGGRLISQLGDENNLGNDIELVPPK